MWAKEIATRQASGALAPGETPAIPVQLDSVVNLD